eukprot:COSAG05_NODE_3579_length_1982_cov_14.750929_1_plen_368_part_00
MLRDVAASKEERQQQLLQPPANNAPHHRARIRGSVETVTRRRPDDALHAADDGGAQKEPLPAWWLLFLGGFCFCPAVTNNCVLPLLLPPLVEKIVGPAHKAASLGMLSTAGFSLSLSMPFLGMLSDRMTGSFGQRFGRRRPFIIAGQLLNSSGLVVLALATSVELLTLGYMMLYAGNILAWVPYMTVLPTIIPPQQRGAYAGYQQLCDSLSWATGSGLGIAIGQGLLSNNAAYTLFVVLNLLQLPYGVAAMGSRPGWWYSSPEVPPVADTHQASQQATATAAPQQQLGWTERVCAAVVEFFSAWRNPAFAMLWAYIFLVQVAGITAGTWSFYWYRLSSIASRFSIAMERTSSLRDGKMTSIYHTFLN